jgi:hypothetical protein
MDTLKKSNKRSGTKFEIVGIEVKGIPNVRVSNQPIQQPTPTPTPEPPPPPPPGQ